VLSLPERPPLIAYQHFRMRTDDGVTLGVQSVGQGPPVLVANGIGLTVPVLDFLVDHLRLRHRVILWDYRGAGSSRLASRSADVSMTRHARDALHVLDGLRVPRAAVIGWSMGVTVGLEMLRLAPERVAGLAALFGSSSPPFRGALPEPVAQAIALGFRLTRRVSLPAHLLVRLGQAVPPLAWVVCSAVRFVGPRTHRGLFQRCVDHVAGAQRQAYFRMLIDLLQYDSRELLPRIRCPVLVVSGGDDWVVPPVVGREMATRIAGARQLVLERTSHFGVMEHGEGLWQPIDELLASAWPGEVGSC
jgi:pimeloyl-ACP methyl ester carboxylesterase